MSFCGMSRIISTFRITMQQIMRRLYGRMEERCGRGGALVSFQYLNPGRDARFKDRHTTKVDETLSYYEPGKTGDIGLIGLPLSKTSISLSGA